MIMDPLELRDIELKLTEWVGQGYQIMADEVEGDIRVTTYYVAGAGEVAEERNQELWPMVPETVDLLERNGIPVVRAPSDL
jgi:hypothetical protein